MSTSRSSQARRALRSALQEWRAHEQSGRQGAAETQAQAKAWIKKILAQTRTSLGWEGASEESTSDMVRMICGPTLIEWDWETETQVKIQIGLHDGRIQHREGTIRIETIARTDGQWHLIREVRDGRGSIRIREVLRGSVAQICDSACGDILMMIERAVHDAAHKEPGARRARGQKECETGTSGTTPTPPHNAICHVAAYLTSRQTTPTPRNPSGPP